jgi:hypothetical protein
MDNKYPSFLHLCSKLCTHIQYLLYCFIFSLSESNFLCKFPVLRSASRWCGSGSGSIFSLWCGYGSDISLRYGSVPTFYSDADPDPTFHSDADPVRILFLDKVRRICEHWSTDLNFDLDADPDPAFPYTHVLHHDVGRIALASHSTLNIDIGHLQVCVFTVKQDRSRRGHHYGKT